MQYQHQAVGVAAGAPLMRTGGSLGGDEVDRLYREGQAASMSARMFLSTFFGAIFFAFFAQTSRGLNLLSPLVGYPLIPAIVAGGAFYIATRLIRRYNGGHILWLPMLFLWLMGLVFGNRVSMCRLNGERQPRTTYMDSDRFVRQLNLVTVGIMSLAMLVGYYVGGMFAWGALDGWSGGAVISATPYSPGVFPGQDASFLTQSILIETLGAFVIAALIVSPMLYNRSDLIARNGGLALFVATLIGFNLSGGCFDTAWWTMSHLSACTPTGVCFPDAADWWWGYVLGAIGGALLGVVFAFIFYTWADVKLNRPTLVSGGQRNAAAATAVAASFGHVMQPAPVQQSTDSAIAMHSQSLFGAPTTTN